MKPLLERRIPVASAGRGQGLGISREAFCAEVARILFEHGDPTPSADNVLEAVFIVELDCGCDPSVRLTLTHAAIVSGFMGGDMPLWNTMTLMWLVGQDIRAFFDAMWSTP
jgi:hypothetical protein